MKAKYERPFLCIKVMEMQSLLAGTTEDDCSSPESSDYVPGFVKKKNDITLEEDEEPVPTRTYSYNVWSLWDDKG